MVRRMTFPAPWADKIEHANGTWHDVGWTPEAIAEYVLIGGWFKSTLFGLDPRYRLAPRGDKRRVLAAGHETCNCAVQYGEKSL